MLANNVRLSSVLAILYGSTGIVSLCILIANVIEDRGWSLSFFVLFVPIPLMLLATALFFAFGRKWPRHVLLVALSLLIPFCLYLAYGWVVGITAFNTSDRIAYLVAISGVLLLYVVYAISAVIAFHSSHFQRDITDQHLFEGTAQACEARPKRLKRALLFIVVLSYLFTWLFGVPAVQSSADSWATNEYRRIIMQGRSDAGLKYEPHMKTYVSFPLFPGVVLSYRDYQLAGLYGFGGFQFHFWYVIGSKEVFSFPVWLS